MILYVAYLQGFCIFPNISKGGMHAELKKPWEHLQQSGPSMAVILGPGDHLWQQKLPQMVWGDHAVVTEDHATQWWI